MRGFTASLLVAIIILAISIAAATVGALGVAAVGWLLHRWFDLTQWQGSLIAFGMTVVLGYLVYKLAAAPSDPSVWDEDLDQGEEDVEEEESPIVPWRRSRPAQSEKPVDKRPEGTKRRGSQ
jgi:hypothetical protein